MESLNTEKCFTFHSVVKRSVTEHQLTSCEVNEGPEMTDDHYYYYYYQTAEADVSCS